MLMRRMLFIFIGVVLVGGIYAAESPNLEGKIRDRIDLSNMDLSGLNLSGAHLNHRSPSFATMFFHWLSR